MRKIPELNIGNLKVDLPIIQGGMGVGISLSGLASAVANAGGIGVIATVGVGMLESDFYTHFNEASDRALRREIRKAKKMTKGILGANIMVALTNFDDIVKLVTEEGIDIVFLSAGLAPTTLPIKKLIEAGIKVVPKGSSARVAKIIFQRLASRLNYVPDAVVIEGPLSGGHQGFSEDQITDSNFALEKLLPEVLSVIKPFEEQFGKKIPVIAAGGIFTGSDIYKFIKMGASGVKMGTRFVGTNECDADEKFKMEYIRCKKNDTIIIDSPVGLPARVIRNKFIDDINAGRRKPVKCPLKCLITCKFPDTPYCIALALTNAKIGNLKGGYAFGGTNAYRVNEIISVKKLIKILIQEYKIAAQKGLNYLRNLNLTPQLP